jgi:ABC-type oligopeptide transport system substrate-binding subunit
MRIILLILALLSFPSYAAEKTNPSCKPGSPCGCIYNEETRECFDNLNKNNILPAYGLAMHGEAKYNENSTHLDYAYPYAPKGGTLHHAAIGTFDTLNPYTIKGKAAQGLNLVYDRLMARVWDEPFTMYPLIAQSYDIAEDRSWISFTLDPRARFHDGSAITIEDIKFTFDTLREFGRPNMRRIYDLVKTVETTENTIKFTFKENSYDQEATLILAMMPVFSKTDWDGKNFDSTSLTPPLGSGPYKITNISAGRRVELERVKDYWAADLLPNKGHNNFDRIVYDYFRDDGVALEAFKSGATNLRLESDIARWNTAYDIPAIKNGTLVKESIIHQRPEKARGLIFNTRRAPFDDIRVREALGLLLDEEWLNKNLFYGQHKRINSYFPNSELAAPQPKIEAISRRLKMRQAYDLLDQAGWKIVNGKRMKDGKPFTFEILLGAPEDEKIALAFKRAIEKAGITTNIRVLDVAAYRGRLNEYDFDMTIYFWSNTLSPGTEQMLYWTCEAADAPARWNFPGICDPQIDALAAAIAQSKTREELVNATHTLDQRLINGHYMIPLFYQGADNYVYQSTIRHPEKTPIYGAVLETWWMDQNSIK